MHITNFKDMTDRIELNGVDYWINYTYEKEEISNDHHCPARLYLNSATDENGNEIFCPGLLRIIEDVAIELLM